MKEYNVGDKVWFAKYQRQEVQVTCPICFGKMKVRLILGDDSEVETECTYCERGFQKYGYVIEYDYVSDVELVEITGKEVREYNGERTVEYRHGNYCLTPDNCFDSKEEAGIELAKKIELVQSEELNRLKRNKDGNPKRYSWHVGYYQRQIHDAEKNIEIYSKKVKHFKSKVKEEKVI